MEKICEGFTIEYRDDGILVYRLDNMRRDTVEALAAISKHHEAEAWLGCCHLLRMIVLEDVSIPTPLATVSARALKEETPEHLQESLALVGNDSTTYQLARIMQSQLSSPDNMEVFDNTNAALDWLNARVRE